MYMYLLVHGLFRFAEAVFDCIGRNTKVNYMALMQYEVKPDKFDSRVLVGCYKL